jgi:hypothetical protein
MTGKLAATIAAVGMIVVAGCGGSEQGSDVQVDQATTTPAATTSASAKPAGTLKITKIGFGTSKSAAGSYVHPVAIIHNGTKDIAALQINFVALDAAGEVLAQTDTSAPVARAGATVASETTMDLKSGTVAKVTAEINVLEKKPDEHPESAFIASGVRYRPGSYDASVTGKITSRYVDSVKDAYVAAVCVNGDGKIVGGGSEFFSVKGGGQTAVEVNVTGKNIKSCQLYPTLSGASSTG